MCNKTKRSSEVHFYFGVFDFMMKKIFGLHKLTVNQPKLSVKQPKLTIKQTRLSTKQTRLSNILSKRAIVLIKATIGLIKVAIVLIKAAIVLIKVAIVLIKKSIILLLLLINLFPFLIILFPFSIILLLFFKVTMQFYGVLMCFWLVQSALKVKQVVCSISKNTELLFGGKRCPTRVKPLVFLPKKVNSYFNWASIIFLSQSFHLVSSKIAFAISELEGVFTKLFRHFEAGLARRLLV